MRLLTKKMLVTFLAGFVVVFAPGIVGLFDDLAALAASGDPVFDVNAWGLVLASLISGAIAAGTRAVIAVLPFNMVPTDALHGLGDTPTEVIVDKKS